MKRRKMHWWMVWAALCAHVFAPLAAHAVVTTGVGFGDLCTASGKTPASGATPAGLPAQGSDRHGMDHCATCPGGSATAAMLPPTMSLLEMRGRSIAASRIERDVPASLNLLLPPSRAPPASS
jgi:hypothetical protein